MSQKKNTNSNSSNFKSYLKLQFLILAVCFVLFLIFSAVSVGADIKKDYMFYVSLGFIGASSFIAGFIAGIKERKNGMVYGLINALPLNAILFLISLILNGFGADINLLFSVLISLVLSAVGGIVSVNIRLK